MHGDWLFLPRQIPSHQICQLSTLTFMNISTKVLQIFGVYLWLLFYLAVEKYTKKAKECPEDKCCACNANMYPQSAGDDSRWTQETPWTNHLVIEINLSKFFNWIISCLAHKLWDFSMTAKTPVLLGAFVITVNYFLRNSKRLPQTH